MSKLKFIKMVIAIIVIGFLSVGCTTTAKKGPFPDGKYIKEVSAKDGTLFYFVSPGAVEGFNSRMVSMVVRDNHESGGKIIPGAGTHAVSDSTKAIVCRGLANVPASAANGAIGLGLLAVNLKNIRPDTSNTTNNLSADGGVGYGGNGGVGLGGSGGKVTNSVGVDVKNTNITKNVNVVKNKNLFLED